MNIYFKIMIGILGAIYIFNPVDIFPDLLPYIGWLDDIFLFSIIGYYIITGRLPNFFNKISRFSAKQNNFKEHSQNQKNTYNNQQENQDYNSKFKNKTLDPYEVLGIKPGSTTQEIKAAYRKAVQDYHPDKVAHLGKDLQELAQKKFVEIQKAYKQIMREF